MALRPAVVVIASLLGVMGPTIDTGGWRWPGAAAQSEPAAREGDLVTADIDRAIASISDLGAFFGRLAGNDPNRLAVRFWSGLEAHYAQAGARLADLRKRGRVRIDLLGGRSASDIEAGAIVLDRSLGGQWQGEFVRSTRRAGGDDWGYVSLLSSALLDAMARLEPERSRAWFAMHQRRSNLTKPISAVGPVSLALARFWHIKDKYLWLSMPTDAGTDPETRRRNEGRRAHLYSEMIAAVRVIDRDLGGGWSERLNADWRDYDRMVRQFSTNRGWLTAAPGTWPAAEPGSKLAAKPPSTTAAGGVVAVPPRPKPKPQVAALPPETAPSEQEAFEAREKLTTALRISREEVARLRAEVATGREVVAALEQDLEVERDAARRALDGLEARLTQALDDTRREAAMTAERLSAELGASRETIADLRDQLNRERAASRQEIARLEGGLAERLAATQAEAASAQERLAADLSASGERQAALEAELAASQAAAREKIGGLEERLARESEKALEIQALKQVQLEAEPTRLPGTGLGVVTKLPPEVSQAPDPDQGQIREPTQPGQQLALLPRIAANDDGKLWIAALGALVLAALALAWAAAGLLHRRRTAALGSAAGGPGLSATPGRTGQAAAARPAGSGSALSERPGLERPGQPGAEKKSTPQSLVEALRRGDLARFRAFFGEMTGLSDAQLERILDNPSGENLAIVCRALAMDKLVLASIFLLSHKARSGGLEVRPQDLSTAMAHYDRVTQDAAGEILQTWLGNPDLPGTVERQNDNERAGAEQPGSK